MEIILLMAQTIDGKIARSSEEKIDWTGPFDKAFFQHETKKAGVVIMGSKTFDMIGKPLKDRLNIVLTKDTSRRYQGLRNHKDVVFTKFYPKPLIDDLLSLNCPRVFLIGGSEINTLFAKNNLIDKVWMTFTPRVFGKGLNSFNAELDIKLDLQSHQSFPDGGVLLKYNVNKKGE